MNLQEHRAALQQQAGVRQSLEQQTEALCGSCEPADAQLLRGRLESGLLPYLEAQRAARLRLEALERLQAFLQSQGMAAVTLRALRQTVEAAGSWDRARVEELQRELAAAVPEVGRLEALAAGLDGGLRKGHLHVGDSEGARTSCRWLADALSGEVDAVRALLGSKQSEAEALGALWASFRQRKEQLLQTVEDIEEKADHQSMKEPGLQALQQR
ncbi:hypothetical protein CRUP_026777 [Coryphaenoides rupestris]|nr:hypothetical protein CRUP_026777 [Coryphaenoides rupestris]